jgi:hypothetical protein
MQKVVKFLESYVQWLALGLGLLWVLWIGYSYWAKPSTVVTITTPSGPQQVGPSDVDDIANAPDGPVDKLKKALDNRIPIPKNVSEVLNTNGPQYVDDLKAKMSLNDVTLAPVKPMWNGMVAKGPTEKPTTGPSEDKVPLPTIMAAAMTSGEISNGLSVAWVPNLKKPVDATANATPVPEIGRVNTQTTQQPGDEKRVWTVPNTGGGDNNAAVTVALETKDVSWITDTARWNMKQLQQSFKSAGLPDASGNTLFLRVRLVREEQMADGSWGNHKYIDDLSNQAKLPWPPKDPQEEGVYLDWAGKTQADIVEPPFFEVLRGNLWRTASMPDMGDAGDQTQQAATDTNFDPSTVKPGEVSKLSPENLKKYRDWKAEQDAQERERRKSEAESRKAQQKPPSGGGSSGGGAPRGGLGGKYSPPPANDQPISRKYVPNGAPPVSPSEGVSTNRGNPYRGEGGAAAAAAANAQPSQPPQPGDFFHGEIPQGRFNPAAQHDLEIWAHDDSAVPGHTYRYKLEVSLLNPLYKTENLAKNPADENKLAITVETDWSKPVTLPTKQKFFAYNGGNNALASGAKMTLEYFWWEDGKWNSKMLTVQPGDAIPNTGWTVVDLKPVSNGESKAITVNEAGEMATHFYKTDLKDPEYARLKALVAKSTAAATPQQTGSISQ